MLTYYLQVNDKILTITKKDDIRMIKYFMNSNERCVINLNRQFLISVRDTSLNDASLAEQLYGIPKDICKRITEFTREELEEFLPHIKVPLCASSSVMKEQWDYFVQLLEHKGTKKTFGLRATILMSNREDLLNEHK